MEANASISSALFAAMLLTAACSPESSPALLPTSPSTVVPSLPPAALTPAVRAASTNAASVSGSPIGYQTTIIGTVRYHSPTGRFGPAVNAKVRILDDATGSVLATAYTDGRGSYRALARGVRMRAQAEYTFFAGSIPFPLKGEFCCVTPSGAGRTVRGVNIAVR